MCFCGNADRDPGVSYACTLMSCAAACCPGDYHLFWTLIPAGLQQEEDGDQHSMEHHLGITTGSSYLEMLSKDGEEVPEELNVNSISIHITVLLLDKKEFRPQYGNETHLFFSVKVFGYSL